MGAPAVNETVFVRVATFTNPPTYTVLSARVTQHRAHGDAFIWAAESDSGTRATGNEGLTWCRAEDVDAFRVSVALS